MNNHIERRISEGKWIAIYPYGYERYIDDCGEVKIRINKPQAQIVKKIFELYATGEYSFEMIAQYMNTLNKDIFYKAKIENIIKKPFYYGYMKIKGVLYPHCYGAIITKDIFDKVHYISSHRRGTWRPPSQKELNV